MPRKREILYLQPGGGEGVQLKVTEESDIGITTEQVEKLPYKHIKLNKGWDFPEAKRYLTVRGDIPLTCYITEEEEVKTPITDFLAEVWGEKWEKMPQALKDELGNLGVTVTVKPVNLEPEQEQKLTPYLVFQTMREHFMNVLSTWARSEPRKDFKDELMSKLMLILLGAFAMYFLVNQHII